MRCVHVRLSVCTICVPVQQLEGLLRTTVALQFILNIDEALHAAFNPKQLKRLHHSIKVP